MQVADMGAVLRLRTNVKSVKSVKSVKMSEVSRCEDV